MAMKLSELKSRRDRLFLSIKEMPGIEGVSITKTADGRLALAVHVHQRDFNRTHLPRRFDGLPVIKQKSGDFVYQ